MCKNATATAASLMAAIEPTVVNLLTELNLATTPDGIAAITAFNAAQKALASWVPGTSAQTVIEAINAFTAVFNVLPIPADAKDFEDTISAAIVIVVGILTGNSPPATPPVTMIVTAPTEEIQAAHAHEVMDATTEQAMKIKPSFKRSIWHSAAHQYNNTWNNDVKKNLKYAALKIQNSSVIQDVGETIGESKFGK
jgi:hypothetical protein